MGSSNISIKHLVIAIIVMAIFFYAGYGLVNDKAKENTIPTREEVLKKSLLFEAMNILDPVKADEFYKMLYSTSLNEDGTINDEILSKFLLSVRAWFENNLGNIFMHASDESVNEYGKHSLNVLNTLLDSDPTGVYCFNVLYPGVLGNFDIPKLKEDTKKLTYKGSYLISIAESINQKVKVDRLPVEQVKEVISSINEKMAEKYGDAYYIEDPQELAKQPSLECNTRRDFYKHVMELDTHLSAEVIRYLHKPE
ncbi:hypothetical protein ID854_03395 [Xenorhabdus sp. M]|uniref:Uncharacterized protein n=1 Tax=Xenorhabdus szentirmaii TaxID=290112 RepID=A0AAW3YTD1_9GAMM|nr:hypothetical protein [Xenorhabdus sp. M]MBD2799528.1 hypothetical protein [Xenorhabdus sp. M]